MTGLAINDLSLAIGQAQILRDVSLAVQRGKILGLVGESGSGKSMTALSVMRLLPDRSVLSGDMILDSTRLSDLSEPQMCALRGQRIGMIFQEPMTALNPVQTIGDQVAETLLIHTDCSRSEARAKATRRLARVGLAQMPLDRFPHELSGGQRQRVCIAMAIALRPAILIADEPTTALDVTTQAQILDLLKELVVSEGMALMLITHDLAVVADMADHVAVMKSGEVVEHGQTQTLFQTMTHPYTRALFHASAHRPARQNRAQETDLLRVHSVVRDYPTARPSLFAPRGRFRAVDHVDFSLKRGESLGLVGESGCGKSTLTRAILGLDPVQAGEIVLEGQPVTPDMPADLRRRMQVVFQDPYGSFNPRHKVARLIAEPFYLTGTPPDILNRIAETLVSVGLAATDADKYPHEFSGGQRQRIAIARALITRPDLILLDEAVSALDVQVRAQILDLLADLQAQFGLSYLFISHDLTVVRAITDRVLVMQKGRIVEHGPTEQVFSAPRHTYTQALLAAAPTLPQIGASV